MGKSLADTVIHVPMLLRYRASRRVGSGVRVDASVQLVDVVPTVCDLVGVVRPKRLDGRSLLAASDDPPRVVLSELYTEGKRPPEEVVEKLRSEALPGAWQVACVLDFAPGCLRHTRA